MTNGVKKPLPPPGINQMLDIFKRVVSDDYWRPIAEGGPGGEPDDSYSIFRGMARVFSTLSAKFNTSTQALYALPGALQTGPPASSGLPAGVGDGVATVARVGPSTEAVVIYPGQMMLLFDSKGLKVPGEARTYVNADTIVWNPGDTDSRKVRFVCDAVGYAGNLDFIEDPETGLVPDDLILIKDQSNHRANIGGSILFGATSLLMDSGVPSVFIAEDVGLYVRIDDAANVENVGQIRKIIGFESPEQENPPGTGRFPRYVLLDDNVRKNSVEVLQDDNGVFTDYDQQARDENGVNDVAVLPDPFSVGDAMLIGYTRPFNGFWIRLDTAGEGEWEVVWEYWDGSNWQDVDGLDDPTKGLRPDAGAGECFVSWQEPIVWLPQPSPSGSGINLFFIRMRVISIVAVDVVPVAGRITLSVNLPLSGYESPLEAFQDDGGVVVNMTTQSTNLVLNDVELLPSPPVVDDAFYFGADIKFSAIQFLLTTPGEGDWTLAWEYFDDSSDWVPLPGLQDGSDAFRFGGNSSVVVSWPVPTDWAKSLSLLDGVARYQIRARVETFVGMITQPLATWVKLGTVQDLGTVKWTLLDFNADQVGLALDGVDAQSGGTDDNLWLLGDNRGLYQQNLESDNTFRDRLTRLADVVSPNAIIRVCNRILRPMLYSCKVHDVQIGGNGGGYTGLWLDMLPSYAPEIVGALDLYGPGDKYPKNPWMVLQSIQEAYGWFLVELPYIGEGDFGIGLDDGPLYFDSVQNVYYGGALSGFMDGFPVLGYAAYSAIHSAVDAARAGGVGFTMIRSKGLTDPEEC